MVDDAAGGDVGVSLSLSLSLSQGALVGLFVSLVEERRLFLQTGRPGRLATAVADFEDRYRVTLDPVPDQVGVTDGQFAPAADKRPSTFGLVGEAVAGDEKPIS